MSREERRIRLDGRTDGWYFFSFLQCGFSVGKYNTSDTDVVFRSSFSTLHKVLFNHLGAAALDSRGFGFLPLSAAEALISGDQ